MPSPRPPLRALLIDLSGTLHVGDTPTPGAARALARLRAAGLPIRFCSNRSKESTAALRARLERMGLDDVRADELWTSIGAVRGVLHARGIKRPYVLASASAAEEIGADRDALPAGAPHDAVVLAFAPGRYDYDALNGAFRVLVCEHASSGPPPADERAAVPLLVTHRSRVIQDADGALSLGPGPFVAALEHAAGVSAEVVGKPTRAFFETVIQSLDAGMGAAHGAIAMIGDDLENDLGGGARELGLWRVLVKTGKYRSGDEVREGVHPPDEVVESFAAFVEALLGTEQ